MSNEAEHENVLPEAVRRQMEQADAIIAQMKNDPEAPAPAPEPKADDPAPTPPPPAPEPPPPAPKEEPTSERTDWKQKYSVLKGKYDAEVPRLHDDLRDARGQLRTFQDQLSTLQATVAALKEVKSEPAKKAEPLVSQEEIDQFGPDLIDVMQRVAKQTLGVELDSQLAPVKQSVKQVNERVASTSESVAKSSRQRLYERLDAAVPGWQTTNKDQEFLSWLAEEDPTLGEVRGNLLRGHFERNDADRVIKIFKGFQKEHVVETTDPSPATPAEETPEPQQKLDELVAPGTPKTGSTGAHEESGKGRIWTQKEIGSFYEYKNEFIKKNPNKELPDEVKAAERDLFKAQTENRIRP